jgi:hypothetical protein
VAWVPQSRKQHPAYIINPIALLAGKRDTVVTERSIGLGKPNASFLSDGVLLSPRCKTSGSADDFRSFPQLSWTDQLSLPGGANAPG